MEINKTGYQSKHNFITVAYFSLLKKISDMFKPEEVEVTFEQDHGKIVSYTYTKVPEHKQVA